MKLTVIVKMMLTITIGAMMNIDGDEDGDNFSQNTNND